MDTVFNHIRNHLLEQAGIIDYGPNIINTEMGPEEIALQEWNMEFAEEMIRKLVMGFFRYGPVGKQATKGMKRIEYMKTKIDMYEKDGNGEHLTDLANFAMMEFTEENHPNFHHKHIDDGYHCGR